MSTVLAATAAALIAAGCGETGSSSNATSSKPTSSAQHKSSSSKSKPSGDAASVDKNTRAYTKRVQACRAVAALARSIIAQGKGNAVDMADTTTQARDTCNNIRTALATMSHDHFDNEAVDAWSGVDEIKSGLNAVLAYLDNPRPSKIIEARDKLNEGDALAKEGLHGINVRRHVYGLKALKS
jgi:hypothetical protein